MIHTLLVGLTLAAAITSAQPQTAAQINTYTTAQGGTVYATSTDSTRFDDDIIIYADETAQAYIDSCGDMFTLYTIANGEIVEAWAYGNIICDWQTWALPNIYNTIQF